MVELGELIGSSFKESQETKEQVSFHDPTSYIVKRFYDEFEVRPLSVVIKTTRISEDFIIGHPSNAILGESKLGVQALYSFIFGSNKGKFGMQFGKQSRDVIWRRVINPFNTWEEYLVTNLFNDFRVTTATWDTSAKTIRFGTGDGTKVAQTMPIFKNLQIIGKATLSVTETKPADTDIRYYLSPDAGLNWEEVFPEVEKVFNNIGQELKLKIEFDRDPGADEPYVSNLVVLYEVI